MKKTFAFNPLSMPTYVMAKPNGSSCNLNCSYCYYLEKENLYQNRKHLQMSDATLEKYVESYIQAQPVPEVLFTWHGGETLLRDISFYQKALSYQKNMAVAVISTIRSKPMVLCLPTSGVNFLRTIIF